MKFSILVPVYNVEKYLEQCVESLLNQTYQGEYEIILVDDGSTDSSGTICDRYAEKFSQKVRVIHKKNEGLVSARQVGIENALGEYSLFVDSDDFVDASLLETVFVCLKRNDNPDIVIYSFNYFSSGKIIKRNLPCFDNEKLYKSENKKELYNLLICTPYITALWIKAIKTDLLKNDPTDYSKYYSKNMAEDWFRSIPLLTSASKIVCINTPLYYYRTNEESISRSFKPETINKKNILYVYNRLTEYLPLWNMDTEEYRQKLSARWLSEAMYTFTQYYEYAESSEDRKKILEYDWSSMVPDDVKNGLKNPYENKIYRKLFDCLVNRKYSYIKTHFTKKSLIKKYRNIKSRLLNK